VLSRDRAIVIGKRQAERHCWRRDSCWISEGALFPSEERSALVEAYLKRDVLQQEVWLDLMALKTRPMNRFAGRLP